MQICSFLTRWYRVYLDTCKLKYSFREPCNSVVVESSTHWWGYPHGWNLEEAIAPNFFCSLIGHWGWRWRWCSCMFHSSRAFENLLMDTIRMLRFTSPASFCCSMDSPWFSNSSSSSSFCQWAACIAWEKKNVSKASASPFFNYVRILAWSFRQFSSFWFIASKFATDFVNP